MFLIVFDGFDVYSVVVEWELEEYLFFLVIIWILVVLVREGMGRETVYGIISEHVIEVV